MALELKNIPLKGLFPLPDELADAPTQARATFWKLVGTEALRLKRLEILSGIDRWGNKFVPVKRKWGNPTPLIPHGEASRTYRLLALNSSAQGATLFWRSGGRVSWPTIMGYHAYKHGSRSLPVRDEIGLSPKSRNEIVVQSEIWKAGYDAGFAAASKSNRVFLLPSVQAQPRLTRIVSRFRASKEQDRVEMQEANRLTGEAQEESRKIMDDLRLATIRKREEQRRQFKERLAAFSPAATIKRAIEWGKRHGVRIASGQKEKVSLDELNAVHREVAKIPREVLDEIKKAGYGLDVVHGRGITEHPNLAKLKGVTPRGWPEGMTWDDAPGAGGDGTVVTANKISEGHGSVNLILHEHAHTYEYSLSKTSGQRVLSSDKEWLDVHSLVEWPDVYLKMPAEGFAESFAQYFHGPETRAALPDAVRAYWEAKFP